MKQIKELILEALNAEQLEKTKDFHQDMDSYKLSDHHFKDAPDGRIYIPLHSENTAHVPPQSVKDHVESLGFNIHDYGKGLAKDKHGRDIKIGKILAHPKNGNPTALKEFNDDQAKKGSKSKSDLHVCISRNREDILGMSTNRGWNSCMNLDGGGNQRYLKHDLQAGTHVAYLVKKSDKNIDEPIARIALKKFHSVDHNGLGKPEKTGHAILRPEETEYGTGGSEFSHTVRKWSEDNFPTKTFMYHKDESVYNDSGSRHYTSTDPEVVERELDKIKNPSVDRDHKMLLLNHMTLVGNHSPRIQQKVLDILDIPHTVKNHVNPGERSPTTGLSLHDHATFVRRMANRNPEVQHKILDEYEKKTSAETGHVQNKYNHVYDDILDSIVNNPADIHVLHRLATKTIDGLQDADENNGNKSWLHTRVIDSFHRFNNDDPLKKKMTDHYVSHPDKNVRKNIARRVTDFDSVHEMTYDHDHEVTMKAMDNLGTNKFLDNPEKVVSRMHELTNHPHDGVAGTAGAFFANKIPHMVTGMPSVTDDDIQKVINHPNNSVVAGFTSTLLGMNSHHKDFSKARTKYAKQIAAKHPDSTVQGAMARWIIDQPR